MLLFPLYPNIDSENGLVGYVCEEENLRLISGTCTNSVKSMCTELWLMTNLTHFFLHAYLEENIRATFKKKKSKQNTHPLDYLTIYIPKILFLVKYT